MKKVLLLLLSLLPAAIVAQEGNTFTGKTSEGVDVSYVVLNDKDLLVEVKSVPNTTKGTVTIPAKTAQYTVIGIGASAFKTCEEVTAVVLPEGIKSIEEAAFSRCSKLASINIPSTVTNIGNDAFYSCSSLTTMSLSDAVTAIGTHAFEDCNNLSAINIPSGVTTISSYCFKGCYALKEITIPSNVRTIDTNAFRDCISLKTLNISEGATTINNFAFYGDNEISSFHLPASVTSIGKYIISSNLSSIAVSPDNPAYDSRDNCNAIIQTKGTKANTLLYGCKTTIIPSTVERIGESSFASCEIKSIVVPEGVRLIEDYAFSGSKVETLDLPSTLAAIGNAAMMGGSKVNTIILRRDKPFTLYSNCIMAPNKIILYVPSGCKAAYEEAWLWEDFKEIIEMAPSLPVINFADNNVKAICVANWDTDGDGELSEDEAAAVTSIGTEFQDRANITSFEELEYFTSVTRIAESAFSDCTNLSSIKLPKGLMTIGSGAFMRCSSLASITIPSTVASIGNMPFAGCNSLSSIIVDDDNNVFDSREDCNAIIQTNTNTLRVGCKQTTYPESVSAIGNYAFAGCTGLTTLNLPNSVTSIGTSAYNKCSNLTSIVMPKSVTNIGSGAFSGCDKLENIVVDSENLVYDSRDNCNAIINTADNTLIAGCKVTQIPSSITIIGESAFLSCSGLTSIEIPEGVTSIKSGAFNSCGDLVSVTIPSSIISIGANAFDWCNALVTVYIYKTEPIRITSNVFPKRANATLYVPAGCKEAYEAANVWKDFKEIVEMEPEPEADTDISQMDNAIYIEPLTGCAGSTVNLQVKLKNVQAATSYGFELVLPEGMSIDVTNDGSFDEEIKLSSRHSNHTLTTNKQADGSYKVAVASLSSKSLADNDGTILNIKSHIADDMALGDYPILVQKPLIVYSDGTKPTVQDVRTRITIEDYTIGDVDGDYVVDLADAVLVINYYVGKTVSNFNAMAADVDGDGIIDLADAVKIINYYVGKIPHLSPTRITKELDPQ